MEMKTKYAQAFRSTVVNRRKKMVKLDADALLLLLINTIVSLLWINFYQCLHCARTTHALLCRYIILFWCRSMSFGRPSVSVLFHFFLLPSFEKRQRRVRQCKKNDVKGTACFKLHSILHPCIRFYWDEFIYWIFFVFWKFFFRTTQEKYCSHTLARSPALAQSTNEILTKSMDKNSTFWTLCRTSEKKNQYFCQFLSLSVYGKNVVAFKENNTGGWSEIMS